MSDGQGRHPRAGILVSRVATATSGIVLTASGVYVVVYLTRWEWNRAIVAAAVFIAMLQVVSTALLASRLRELSTRARIVVVSTTAGGSDSTDGLDAAIAESLSASGVDLDVLAAIRQAGERRAARRFDWLRADSGRVGVFVPVLLGTGMILSGVAWLVERLAGLVAGHSVDRTAARAAPLHLPLGGDGRVPEPRPADMDAPDRTWGRRGRWLTAFLLTVLLAVAGIGLESVRRLTQSVPEATGVTGRTELVVEIRTRGDRSAADVAASLWGVCRERLDRLPGAAVVAASGSRVTLLIDRALGATARRRVTGCMEDFTIDRVLATVVRLEVRHSG